MSEKQDVDEKVCVNISFTHLWHNMPQHIQDYVCCSKEIEFGIKAVLKIVKYWLPSPSWQSKSHVLYASV